MATIMLTKILKIGTSHGVIIPKSILDAYKWERGDVLIFGFAGPEQLYLKRLSDKEINNIKPNEIIKIQ